MKVLAIDDQKLVLIPLEKRLIELGYDVKIETDPKRSLITFEEYKPDLVIVDMNMPMLSGLDIVRHIREIKQSQVPIMVLSGDTEDYSITESFELGVNDYMKKPLSMNEIQARVKKLVGAPKINVKTAEASDTMIQQRCVGVVIPCYNEEKRLLSTNFLEFIKRNSGYHLCFVNDGSEDKTLQTLEQLRKGREDYISIYNLDQNKGKAEAVRLGMLYMAGKVDLDYVGFLDADLSTDLADFDELVSIIENSKYKVVSGSRIARVGANISKQPARKIISLTINYFIQKILSLKFKDTQCGAKIFTKDIIPVAFEEKFITKWIFDVEIFKRITNKYGIQIAKTMLYEKPLERWIHADGSKLSTKDSISIIGQLAQIAWVYREKKNNSKVETSYKKGLAL